MPGFNIHKAISPALNVIVPLQNIILKMYLGELKDPETMLRKVTYTDVQSSARIQLENTQKLMHYDGISTTSIIKRFYINSYTLKGLNRNIQTGGDYILHKDLYYKIIEVKYNFDTGWVAVIAVQSNGIPNEFK